MLWVLKLCLTQWRILGWGTVWPSGGGGCVAWSVARLSGVVLVSLTPVT